MEERHKILSSKAQFILKNVVQYCETEANDNKLLVPLSQFLKRAAKMAGVSKTTLCRVKAEITKLPNTSKISTPGKHRITPGKQMIATLENFEKCVIRNVIIEYYVANKTEPSIAKLLPIIKERIYFPWAKTYLYYAIKDIGFNIHRWCSRRPILLENPDIVSWRFKYLRDIKQYKDENRHIVYIGETCIDSATLKKRRETLMSNSRLKKINFPNRLIIMHAGGIKGFIPKAFYLFEASNVKENFQSYINHEIFENWLCEKLIPNLLPNSVICLDNAIYHSKKAHDFPSKYSAKSVMIKWLEDQGLVFDPTLRKFELYQLINEKKLASHLYRVDELFTLNGHDVLRIPPHHWDLNPIEFAWTDLKKNIREEIETKNYITSNVLNLVEEGIELIDENQWKNYCQHVQKIEDFYWENDAVVETVIDNILSSYSEKIIDSGSEESSCDEGESNETETVASYCDMSYYLKMELESDDD